MLYSYHCTRPVDFSFHWILGVFFA